MHHEEPMTHRFDRRQFLRIGGAGMLAATAAGGLTGAAGLARRALAAPPPEVRMRLVATDGFISLPGRADPLYMFGFAAAPLTASLKTLTRQFKGKVTSPAPLIGVDEGTDFYLTLTNVGFQMRPDLDDSHTVHWHGFRNPAAIFDGTPEMSVAVPVGRDFTYFYRVRGPGTYMYHCHFEDVEHVQLGMTGLIYVRPAQNQGTDTLPSGKYAYNDGDGSTAYDREFAILLNEIDPRPHDNLLAVQGFQWTDYKPSYWVMNARTYPDTLKPNNDRSLPNQPLSSLIQISQGETGLLRLSSLGYQQHAVQLSGIQMNVVGVDATLLRAPDGTDLSFSTSTIYIGPGESRDALFSAPAYDPVRPGGSQPRYGPYNTYPLRSRNLQALTNAGQPGLGGMATEVRVYRDPLPAQTQPNQTYA